MDGAAGWHGGRHLQAVVQLGRPHVSGQRQLMATPLAVASPHQRVISGQVSSRTVPPSGGGPRVPVGKVSVQPHGVGGGGEVGGRAGPGAFTRRHV